jgi:hypothetical protein
MALTLKEAYEYKKKFQHEKISKFMESISIDSESVFSNPKTLAQISESIDQMEQIAEIAKPLIPTLAIILEKNSKLLNEEKSNDVLNSYAALAEFFGELSDIIAEGNDLYVSFKNSLGGSLLKEDSNIRQLMRELNRLSESKLEDISSVFPKFPLILNRNTIDESVKFLSENIESDILFEQPEQNLLLLRRAVEQLNGIIESLDVDPSVPNDKEFPRTKKGLNDLIQTIQQVTSTGKAGRFGPDEQKVLMQVKTAIQMIESLANNWESLSVIMSNQIKQIEKTNQKEFEVGGLEKNPAVQNAMSLVKSAIVRQLSSVAGSGGFLSNLWRKWKGKPVYSKGLNPTTIADDIIDLLSIEVSKQEETPETTSQSTPVPPEPAKLNESLDDLKNALGRISGALQKLRPVAKAASSQISQVAKAVGPTMTDEPSKSVTPSPTAVPSGENPLNKPVPASATNPQAVGASGSNETQSVSTIPNIPNAPQEPTKSMVPSDDEVMEILGIPRRDFQILRSKIGQADAEERKKLAAFVLSPKSSSSQSPQMPGQASTTAKSKV